MQGNICFAASWWNFSPFFPYRRVIIIQVVILIIIPTIRRSESFIAMKLLKFSVLFQYVPRLIKIYPLFTKATRTSGKLAGAAWLKAAFNLLLYMFAGHVFGALWYFFAIVRETVCWNKACINRTRCHYGSFYCGDNLGDYTFLNNFCPTKTQNTTLYDFGIFNDALQFGIVEVTDFPQNFLHCFRRGLQKLRSLVANLEEGTAGESSRDYKDETNSVSRIIRDVPKYISKHWLQVKKILDSQGPLGIWICLTFIVIEITLDPLFFYIPVVNDDQKCLRLDKYLGIIVTVLHSVFDFFYIIFIIFRLRTDLYLIYKGDAPDKDALKHLLHFFLIDLLAILPLPQVMQPLFYS
ncbi:hypothetical protein Pint_11058 [Pistacia integerrima]|uniref:Uncharacterized protein n=1 Tax=Pistacia integerrima TaxID=434235 RepID=A0ACC0XFJ0_9ROSI|nr:hypothetical protein Pint_11058 [Pistacia integerrima]